MLKLPIIIGIYTITNLVNGKIYVGYTKNCRTRKKSHFCNLKYNRHPNSHLQAAYNTYGESNIEFDILEECEEQYLCSQEHYWCNVLNTHNREYGYNVEPTHPDCECNRRSKETAKKTSNGNKGKKRSPEHIEFLKNREISDELREFFRLRQLGTKQSQTTIERRKQSIRNIPKEDREASIKRAVETKRKKADERGFFISEEAIKKIVSKRKEKDNYKQTKETKEKISRANKGQKRPKMSEILRGRPSCKIKKVYQYDLNGNFIKEWESADDAAKILFNKLHGKLISNVCRLNDGNTAYNYFWSYEKMDFYSIKAKNTIMKIIEYSLEGQFIKEWDSIDELSKNISVNINSIRYTCTNYNLDTQVAIKDRIFRIKGDYNPSISTVIHQYDLEGNFIKEWENNLVLIAKELNYWGGDSISLCLRGKKENYKNFKWSFNKKVIALNKNNCEELSRIIEDKNY